MTTRNAWTKPPAKSVSGRRWNWCLIVLGIVSIDLQPYKVLAQADFPSPATRQLVADFQCFVAAQPLRKTLQIMSESTQEPRLPIILDRRIDPTAPLQLAGQKSAGPIGRTEAGSFDDPDDTGPIQLGPTLLEALETVAKQRTAFWVSVDDAILIGPNSNTIFAATEMLASRKLIENSRSPFPPKQVAWPVLSTPQQALQAVADTWQLDASQVELPHDLWPEISLAKVHVTTALGIVGSQFDLHLVLDPQTRQVTARPINRSATLTRQYPGATLTAQDRQEITAPTAAKSESGEPPVGLNHPATLRKVQANWELTGDALAHQRLAIAVARSHKRKSANGNQPLVDFDKLYALEFAGPAINILQALCQAAGATLDVSEVDPARTSNRIKLSIKDQPLSEILKAAAAQIECTVRFEGDRAIIKSP